MTEQEYLEYEEYSQIRHEYIDGAIYHWCVELLTMLV